VKSNTLIREAVTEEATERTTPSRKYGEKAWGDLDASPSTRMNMTGEESNITEKIDITLTQFKGDLLQPVYPGRVMRLSGEVQQWS
jgi:hypothetical protein